MISLLTPKAGVSGVMRRAPRVKAKTDFRSVIGNSRQMNFFDCKPCETVRKTQVPQMTTGHSSAAGMAFRAGVPCKLRALLLSVGEVSATVLLPASFGAFRASWFFFSVAD